MKKRKSSPFKMWGSWIIASLGGAWSGITVSKILGNSQELVNSIQQGVLHLGMGKASFQAVAVGFFDVILNFPYYIYGYCVKLFGLGYGPMFAAFVTPIIFIVGGFLLGWRIEVLLRKNKWFGLK